MIIFFNHQNIIFFKFFFGFKEHQIQQFSCNADMRKQDFLSQEKYFEFIEYFNDVK